MDRKTAVYEIRVFPRPQQAVGTVMPAGTYIRRGARSWQWAGSLVGAEPADHGLVAVHYLDAGDVHRCVSMPSGALDRPCSELFQMLPGYPHDRECRPMLKAWLRHQGLGEDVADQMVLGEVVYG